MQLCRHCVYCINNKIIISKIYKVAIGLQIELIVCTNLCIGIDIKNALFHNVNLVSAQRTVQRQKLTVNIGLIDRITVNKRNFTYARSC